MWAAHNIPFSVMWVFFWRLWTGSKKKKAPMLLLFLLNFLWKRNIEAAWRFYVSELERCLRSADIWVRNDGDLYPEKLWAEFFTSMVGFLVGFLFRAQILGTKFNVESPRLFPIAVGAAFGFVNLYLAINIAVTPSSSWGTGSWNPRGHIKFSVQIHAWRCLCSFSQAQELSGWALLFWEGKKKGSFLFSWPDHSLSWRAPALGIGAGCGWGSEQRSTPRRPLGSCQAQFHPVLVEKPWNESKPQKWGE